MLSSPLVCATLLWDANDSSFAFSRSYDESWVLKLFSGFRRNLNMPFDFVVFTDRERDFGDYPIIQQRLTSKNPGYLDCLEPYRLDRPMILVGLDTLITGNCDHLAEYCLAPKADLEDWRMLALPRDPYKKSRACNGVALVPSGKRRIWTERTLGSDDMTEVRRWPHQFIDDLFPGHVVSFKGDGQPKETGDRRIVYFHGYPKFHEMPGHPLVEAHWKL